MKFNKLYESIFKGASDTEVEDRKEEVFKIEIKDRYEIDLNNPDNPNNKWDNLDSFNWRRLLIEYPQFAKHCDWSKLDGDNWCYLLIKHPQFAKHCDWSKLNGDDWSWLLREKPQFAEHCEWSKLNGYDWCWLLIEYPQFAEHCDWDKLDGIDWGDLLEKQPQLEKYRNLNEEFVDAAEYKGHRNSAYLELFKNPSFKELNDCGPSCRGVILSNGDLYILTETAGAFLHSDLHKFMQNKNIAPDVYIKSNGDRGYWDFRKNNPTGIDVHRDLYSNNFYLSESVKFPEENGEDSINKVKSFLKLAKDKNPSLEFKLKRIIDIK
jgi:hypothetical protein